MRQTWNSKKQWSEYMYRESDRSQTADLFALHLGEADLSLAD